jgi:hypothetical protein
LRGRFGISAPQVAVRTHVPWYLRAASLVGLAALVAALVWWSYESGRRTGGYDNGEANRIVGELSSQKQALEDEVARLRSLLTASESGLQIEQAAQKSLSERNSLLAAENTKLKEDLAVFEKLSKLEGRAGNEVSLDRLSLRQESPGLYRYSFLIALQGARRGKESKFDYQIIALQKNGSQNDRITIKGDTQANERYEIVLRNFRRIDGKFEVPRDFALDSVEIRVLEGGQLKVSERATL